MSRSCVGWQARRVATLGVAWAVLAGALGACGSPEDPTPRQNQRQVDLPSPPDKPATIELSIDTAVFVVGAFRHVTIEALDDRGAPVSTLGATVTSSNLGVAAVSSFDVYDVVDSRTGTVTRQLSPMLRLVGAGTATIEVALKGVSASFTVNVHQPHATTALVVDSFILLEYRVSYLLLYAPILQLREPTGTHSVEVVAIQYSLDTMTTGLCRGTVSYAPGVAAAVNAIDAYPYNNELIFTSLDGPLSGLPTARVIVRERDDAGAERFGEIDVTGTIQRGVTNPVFPGGLLDWTCN